MDLHGAQSLHKRDQSGLALKQIREAAVRDDRERHDEATRAGAPSYAGTRCGARPLTVGPLAAPRRPGPAGPPKVRVGVVAGHLAEARTAYERRDWGAARDAYRSALGDAPLGGDDLYAYANTYWWLGQLDQALPILGDAHRALLAEGRPRTAALVALDTGYTLALRGEEAQASGWMTRAARLLDGEGDCAERGYLVYCDAEEAVSGTDLDRALALAGELREIGRRFADPCLVALASVVEGRVRIKQGSVREGMGLLDEAMVAALSDDLDPGWAGNIYCNLMLTCYEVADWQRADEWTSATARWCEAMPGAGPFMGICRVHRAQVLHMRGEWQRAEVEVRRVCEELATIDVGMVAEAHYQLGEVQRQRGDLDGAELAFADAHRLGRDPQPGLALLRLARGRPSSAVAMVTRALGGRHGPLDRAHLLPAAVEILVAAGDVDRAAAAADELGSLAKTYGTHGLDAQAAAAAGTVALAAGDAAAATRALQDAASTWRRVGARYEAARARLLLGRALELLGDADAAAMETSAATAELENLGVAPAPPRRGRVRREDGLSAREVEVVCLVADGCSNQEIADRLVLSVRTVERHLASAYQKLGLSGRGARAGAVRYVLDGR
jgi:DNA-binding CsgD family transcriptional regulator